MFSQSEKNHKIITFTCDRHLCCSGFFLINWCNYLDKERCLFIGPSTAFCLCMHVINLVCNKFRQGRAKLLLGSQIRWKRVVYARSRASSKGALTPWMDLPLWACWSQHLQLRKIALVFVFSPREFETMERKDNSANCELG